MARRAVVLAIACAAACERAEREPPALDTKPYATITELGGEGPVQAEGTLPGGKAFYFRARHDAWSFVVGPAVDAAIDAPEWRWGEPYGDGAFDASYLPEDDARAIIHSVARMWAEHVAPPTEFAGVPADERKARDAAMFLLLGAASRLDTDEPPADAAALRAARDKAREAFRGEIGDRYLAIFDDVFAHLEASVRGEAVPQRWLRDAASARSVGRRWAAMLARVPAGAERARLVASGLRWFAAWTPPGAARDALYATALATP